MSKFVGMKITEDPIMAKLLEHQLSDYNLMVGDVVMFKHAARGNSLTLYRITKDHKPMKDLIWGKSGMSRLWGERHDWVKQGTRTKPPQIKIYGCIEITPVVQLLPSGASRHNVAYTHIPRRIMKVDVLAMAKAHAEFHDFIKREVQRLST